jgi:hypothetical protein
VDNPPSPLDLLESGGWEEKSTENLGEKGVTGKIRETNELVSDMGLWAEIELKSGIL